jgi:predicted RNA-binding protein with PUA-like domain
MEMPQFWLVKQEPTTYSWEQFVQDGKTEWTGVRNFQARNNLRAMKVGDQVFYYHSVNGKAIVGLAKVTKEAFRDPTATEGDWSAVELAPERPITPPIALAQLKSEPRLANMVLLRSARLSVSPVSPTEFQTILQIAKRDRSS